MWVSFNIWRSIACNIWNKLAYKLTFGDTEMPYCFVSNLYWPPHVHVQHGVEKTKKGKVALRLSRAQRRILGLLLYILLLNILYSGLSAYVSATVNSTRQVIQDYLRCEATGRQAECSATEVDNALQTNENLVLTFLCVSALGPAILLPFIVNVKELKKSCKHIHSLLRSCCVSKG